MKNSNLGFFNLPVIAVFVLLASCEIFFIPESKTGEMPQIYISPSLSRTT